MAQQQQAAFSNAANYAVQITPPGGSIFGGYGGGPPPGPPGPPGMVQGYGGAHQGGLMSMAAQLPYQMPGQYTSQGFSEQMLGTGLGGLAGVGSGMANIAGSVTGAAGLATAGAGALGMMGGVGFGGGVSALGALPLVGGAVVGAGGLMAMGGAAALAAPAYAGEQLYQGFRERQDVNRVMRQRFGGQMGVGGGRGGMGFNQQEMGQMSTMMRGMAQDDMFTGFDELTRTLDKTSQMGLFRGTQGIKEFQEKFRKTVDTLKEVAKTMHTSLDEAAGLMESQRSQGFFSGSDVSASLMRTRLAAGASGMSIQQVDQIGQQGTMMGRSMGMLGRTGSDAMKTIATNYGVAMQMGVLSDEDVAEATGGLTGAAGAQALAARSMQGSGRFMRRGAGRAMLAGMWDQEGGMDQGMLSKVMAGEVSFREVLSAGRKNIRETGGRRSEFFLDEERLRGQAMAEGGGDVMIGMLGKHIADKKGVEMEDPIVKRWLMRQTGKTRSEIEVAIKQFRGMPEILEQRRIKEAQQLEMEGRTQAREASGFSGIRRRLNQSWEKNVSGRIRQAGDDLLTSVNDAVDDLVGQMEGRIDASMSERGKAAEVALRSTGEGGILGRSLRQNELTMRDIRQRHGGSADVGALGRLGQFMGTRRSSLDDRLEAVGASGGAGVWQSAGSREKISYLNRDAQRFTEAQASINLSETQRSELAADIRTNVLRGGSAAGSVQGILKASGAENFAAIQQRVEYMQQHSAVFRRHSKGMSRHEKIALLEEGSRGVDLGDLALGEYGEDARAAGFAGDLAALEKESELITRNANKFFREAAVAKAGGSKVSGGQAGGGRAGSVMFAGTSEAVGGDFTQGVEMGSLFEAADKNAKLAKNLEVLSNPQALASDRRKAIDDLRAVSRGSDLAVGGGVNEGARKAARAVADASENEKTRAGAEAALEGYNVTAATRATRATTETRSVQAEKLQSYLTEHSSGLRKNLDKDALRALNKLVDARASMNDDAGATSADDVREMEEDFLRTYGAGDAGGDLLTALRSTPAGAYQASALGAARAFRTRAEGEEPDRAKAVLGRTLERMTGKHGLTALGGKREQNRILRAIRRGKTSVKDVMDKMRDKEGDLNLASGATSVMLERELEESFGIMGGPGGTTEKEIKDLSIKTGMEAAQAARQRGDTGTDDDLPALAAKQVGYLKEMVVLTKQIAKKQNIIIKIKDGKVIESPGGGDVAAEK